MPLSDALSIRYLIQGRATSISLSKCCEGRLFEVLRTFSNTEGVFSELLFYSTDGFVNYLALPLYKTECLATCFVTAA